MENHSFQKQLLLLLAFMILFGLASIHLGQDINWDLRNYHFYNPYAFLHHRFGLDIAPAMMQTYFNPFLDILNYSLITTQKPIIVGFILGAISGITAFFVYKITFLFSEKHWLALFSVLIGMTGYAGIVQLGSTTNETKTACLLTIGIYCILKSLRHTEKPYYWLSVGGFLSGLAVGFKLTAATMGLGIIAGFIFIQRPSKQHLLAISMLVFSIGLGFLVSNGYWMWTLYQHFQNPLFPFYNNIFHSPYASLNNFKDTHFHPQDIKHYIFLPFYFFEHNTLSTELQMRDPRLGVTFIFIFLFACSRFLDFFRKRKNLEISSEIKFILIAFIASYASWLIQFAIYRYAVSLEILSGILISYFISYFFKKYSTQITILVILFLAIQADTTYANWGRIPFGKSYFTFDPNFVAPKNSLVILLGGNPLAYTVPFIAPENTVVGVGNNMMSPTNPNKLQFEENKLINDFNGPIYSVSLPTLTLENHKILSYYHLYQDQKNCILTRTHIENIMICPLNRIK